MTCVKTKWRPENGFHAKGGMVKICFDWTDCQLFPCAYYSISYNSTSNDKYPFQQAPFNIKPEAHQLFMPVYVQSRLRSREGTFYS
jgi:hypothetical protein